VLVATELIAPGSEWRLHREWFVAPLWPICWGADFNLAEFRISSMLVMIFCSSKTGRCSIIGGPLAVVCFFASLLCVLLYLI